MAEESPIDIGAQSSPGIPDFFFFFTPNILSTSDTGFQSKAYDFLWITENPSSHRRGACV